MGKRSWRVVISERLLVGSGGRQMEGDVYTPGFAWSQHGKMKEHHHQGRVIYCNGIFSIGVSSSPLASALWVWDGTWKWLIKMPWVITYKLYNYFYLFLLINAEGIEGLRPCLGKFLSVSHGFSLVAPVLCLPGPPTRLSLGPFILLFLGPFPCLLGPSSPRRRFPSLNVSLGPLPLSPCPRLSPSLL